MAVGIMSRHFRGNIIPRVFGTVYNIIPSLLWKIRRNQKIRRRFLEVTYVPRGMARRHFQVSIDRFGYRHADFEQSYNEWWHWDRNPYHRHEDDIPRYKHLSPYATMIPYRFFGYGQ